MNRNGIVADFVISVNVMLSLESVFTPVVPVVLVHTYSYIYSSTRTATPDYSLSVVSVGNVDLEMCEICELRGSDENVCMT